MTSHIRAMDRFGIKNIWGLIMYVVWTLLIVSYYFQFPFRLLSKFIVPLMIVYIVMNVYILFRQQYRSYEIISYLLLAILLTLNCLYSAISGVELERILRFYFILLVIPICFYINKKSFKHEYFIFVVLSFAKAFFLIFIAYLVYDMGDYQLFRQWARQDIQAGDIYMVYGILPRIQLPGNALLLIAFILEYARKSRFTIVNLILLFGVIFEGNFSFYLGLVVFFVYWNLKDVKLRAITISKIVSIFTLFLMLAGFYFYALDQKEAKEVGSNDIRMIQIEAIQDTNLLTGAGLGQKLFEITKAGRSPEDTYIELQTLYILYQIGVFTFALFTVLTLSSIFRFKNCDVTAIYASYLIASFFNPYCFDTTHMITAILCSNYIYLKS